MCVDFEEEQYAMDHRGSTRFGIKLFIFGNKGFLAQNW